MTAGLRKRHKKSVSTTASTARYVFLFTCLCILRLSISRYYNNILLRLLPSSLDYDDQQHIITDLHDAEQNIVPINNIQKQNALNIRYIFGHSTGHSGTTTLHSVLSNKNGCPWNNNSTVLLSKVERIAPGEKKWSHEGINDCTHTNNDLIPFFHSLIKEEVEAAVVGSYSGVNMKEAMYIDIGHWHNRGRVIECLALSVGDQATFIHIRRNRYSVASSFTHLKETPCMIDNGGMKHPGVAVCPRSGERAGPVNLPLDDSIWDSFTPFQRFLWYADEMEHRWYTLKQMFNNNGSSSNSPTFYEIEWRNGVELEEGAQYLRRKLGCLEDTVIENKRKHVKHVTQSLNCSSMIEQDLQYQQMMNYTDEISKLLFRSSPFGDINECFESRDDLVTIIHKFSDIYGSKIGLNWF